jgi:hypothetical protein
MLKVNEKRQYNKGRDICNLIFMAIIRAELSKRTTHRDSPGEQYKKLTRN